MKGVKGPINSNETKPNNKDDSQIKSTGHLFMSYFSKIIVEIYSNLQDHDDKEIKALFEDAINVFNALGSWVYGGTSPKIVYPELQLFIKKANNSNTESFSLLLDYINWVGNTIYKLLEDNQWIEDHYYESFTLEQSNDVTTGLMFTWRIGWLIVSIKDISKENEDPMLLQTLKTFDNLFDAFGGWVYNQEDLINVTQNLQEFESIFEEKFSPIYDEILEEARKTTENIAKFLHKFK